MRPGFAYVGSFTTQKRKARGQGIAVYRIDPESGAWRFVRALNAIPNPHFLALDRTQRFLYSAHGDSSQAGAYARDPADGTLRFLGSQETGGDNSSTVVTDPGADVVFWVIAIVIGSIIRPISDIFVDKLAAVDNRLRSPVSLAVVLVTYTGAWSLLHASNPSLPQSWVSWAIAGLAASGFGSATNAVRRSMSGSQPGPTVTP